MMKLIINYKNETTLEMDSHYVHTLDGKLYYSRVMNPAPVVQPPTSIPLEYIESFRVIMGGKEE